MQGGHCDGDGVLAVCPADTDAGQILSTCLSSRSRQWVSFATTADIDAGLRQGVVTAVVLVLDETPASAAFVERFDGLMGLLTEVKSVEPACPVLLLTPGGLSLEDSCRAVLGGVAAIIDYRRRSWQERLWEHVEAGEAFHREEQQRRRERSLHEAVDGTGLVGVSAALRRVVDQARRAAEVSDAPVVIYGESGTGKQRIAEIIHQLDRKRNARPFVCVNCAAIAGSLAESELFGHRKGAFTGATDDRAGYFRAADGGTILLDEISELAMSLQPKILRVLQEGLVMPVGSDREYAVDVRVIAATNRDLAEMVEAGVFRLDLWQRLNVIRLTVPPLRRRTEDIPPLFETFVKKYAHYCPCTIKGVDPQVYEIIAQTIGAGNVRELENLVRQVLVFKKQGQWVELADLPQEVIAQSLRRQGAEVELQVPDEAIEALLSGRKKLTEALEDYERAMLTRLVEQGYSQTDLADRIGVTRRTLYNKLQRHRLR